MLADTEAVAVGILVIAVGTSEFGAPVFVVTVDFVEEASELD